MPIGFVPPPSYRFKFARPSLRAGVGRGIDEVERRQISDAMHGPDLTVQNVALSNLMLANGRDGGAIAAAQGSLSSEGVLDPTSEGALPPREAASVFPFAVRSPLVEVEDGRRFKPMPSLLPSSRRWSSRFEVANKPLHYYLPHGISPRAKSWVLMCIRRKARRGVILALGQGGGYHRPPRRNPNSDIWC